jgi:hypothetical protein
MNSQPDNPLTTPLAGLGRCWLELRGCCRRIVFVPLPLLAEKHGAGVLLRDVLPRLRCQECGGKPAVMALVERADGGPRRAGSPDGWRIDLVG